MQKNLVNHFLVFYNADNPHHPRALGAGQGIDLIYFGTRAQTTIRFALAQKKLSGVIFGLAELDHLEEAITAEINEPIPQEGIEHLRAVYEKGGVRPPLGKGSD